MLSKSDSYRPVKASNVRRGDGVNHLELDVVPNKCTLCTAPITDNFIDGRTIHGCWATMCYTCYTHEGVGLGLQRGQMFTKSSDGLWHRELK